MGKVLTIMAALAVGGCTAAAATGEAPRGAVQLSAAEAVAARQAGMRLSAVDSGAIKAALDRGAEARSQRFAAEGLARWAAAFPPLFAPGSDAAPSEALPAVWSDRAGFAQRAAEFQAATRRLAELAAANDGAALSAQWEAVEASCKACHDTYRAPRRPSPPAKPAG